MRDFEKKVLNNLLKILKMVKKYMKNINYL